MAPTDTNAPPCLFGEVLFDRFPDGAEVLGGAPFNVAWHLQAFAAEPVFISRVGSDALGQRIRKQMQCWGMSTHGLQSDPAHPTGTVEVSLHDGEPAFDIVAGCAWDHIAADALPDVSPGLLYHGSLVAREPVSAAALAQLKHRTGAPVFLDVNLRPPWWQREAVLRLLADARWAKLNHHEVAELAAIGGDLDAQAGDLRERYGIELLIVTLGAKGAYAIDAHGKSPLVRPGGDETVVDTVGAGDAFASVCILGLLRGWPVATMLERAQQFASAIVGRRGATVDELEFYRQISRQWS